jgi:hypothetical protein
VPCWPTTASRDNQGTTRKESTVSETYHVDYDADGNPVALVITNDDCGADETLRFTGSKVA